MAKLKKIAAACTAAIMCVGMTSCSDTSYVISSGDDDVAAGVYIYNMLSEMSYQMTMMYYTQGITENYFDQQVEGKDFADYLSDYALTSTKEYLAVVKQFNELGLSLTDDEKKTISDTVNDTWTSNGDFYESEGISKASVKLVQQASQMKSDIFNHFYDEGGTEEVKNSDIETYLNDNYLRYKTISIAKSTEEDEDTAAKADKESAALRDEYLKKAEGLSFLDFDTVITEYNDYVAEQAAAESSSAAESDSTASSESTTDSTSSDDTSSVSDTDSSSSAASDDTSSASESESTVSSESTADTDRSDSESDSSSEADPYPNETMTNYGTMTDDDKDTDNGKLLTEISKLEVGVATAYEDDSNYYIIIKGDVSERAAEYAEDNRDSMLQEMKGDEFQTKLDEWVKALDISENSKAINRYTPKVVYDKQEEYYNKTSAS